jgi:tetratricopeptide (TPR) repeat protein/ssDNA-binding Zn-finger/Zn-ribbon topoisomerase 1
MAGCGEDKSNRDDEPANKQASPAKTFTLKPAHYVGRKTCQTCHADQDSLWQGSHHDLAMAEANSDTVLGNFNNVTFTFAGSTSIFSQKDGKYFVQTEGKDGKLQEFEINYTFGAIPLQQYLIAFPDGRYQTLGIAWDSRTKEQGGQRWFHLYPANPPKPGEPLHWTGIDQVWNYQCAECHSTNLQKNYDAERDHYATSWSEINVSCEACHGPASNHLLWANKETGWEQVANRGLEIHFNERQEAAWSIDPQTGTARRNKPLIQRIEVEACARCHSRRGIFSEDYKFGHPILDTHNVSLLRDGLYYSDGQIRDEVYVYASFLQSKMYHAGVTCSDCHEPHSLKLQAEGNGVCLQCHQAEKFDAPAHHKHKTDTPGARCVECHMPETTYMVVDPRRDHSIRIPRPDLSVKLGVPNTCTRCHTDRTNVWAVETMHAWYGDIKQDWQDFATVLHEARSGNPAVVSDLQTVISNKSNPAIARATVLAEVPRYLSPATMPLIQAALQDNDPMVRLAGITALSNTDPALRVQLVFPMLDDAVRAVRLEATRVLMDIPVGQLSQQQNDKLHLALSDYSTSLQVNADRPEAMSQLGWYYAVQGRFLEAEQAYQRAIELDNHFSAAYVNLADLFSRQNQEAQALAILKQGLGVLPEDSNLHHAQGLSLIRAGRYDEAMPALAKAARLAPGNSRYVYVYAVALHSMGNIKKAISTLEQALQLHPYDRQIMAALVSFYQDAGEIDKARKLAERLK